MKIIRKSADSVRIYQDSLGGVAMDSPHIDRPHRQRISSRVSDSRGSERRQFLESRHPELSPRTGTNVNPYFLAAVALTVIIGGFTVIGFLIYRDLKDTE